MGRSYDIYLKYGSLWGLPPNPILIKDAKDRYDAFTQFWVQYQSVFKKYNLSKASMWDPFVLKVLAHENIGRPKTW